MAYSLETPMPAITCSAVTQPAVAAPAPAMAKSENSSSAATVRAASSSESIVLPAVEETSSPNSVVAQLNVFSGLEAPLPLPAMTISWSDTAAVATSTSVHSVVPLRPLSAVPPPRPALALEASPRVSASAMSWPNHSVESNQTPATAKPQASVMTSRALRQPSVIGATSVDRRQTTDAEGRGKPILSHTTTAPVSALPPELLNDPKFQPRAVRGTGRESISRHSAQCGSTATFPGSHGSLSARASLPASPLSLSLLPPTRTSLPLAGGLVGAHETRPLAAQRAMSVPCQVPPLRLAQRVAIAAPSRAVLGTGHSAIRPAVSGNALGMAARRLY